MDAAPATRPDADFGQERYFPPAAGRRIERQRRELGGEVRTSIPSGCWRVNSRDGDGRRAALPLGGTRRVVAQTMVFETPLASIGPGEEVALSARRVAAARRSGVASRAGIDKSPA